VTALDVATHPDQRIHELRHEGVRRSVGLLREGDPIAAFDGLAASVEHQAMLAGCGHVHIPRHWGVW